MQRTVRITDRIILGNELPLVLFGGINVIESYDLTLRVAEHFSRITERLKIPWVFKASFDKANRSALQSFRGPGLEPGLKILAAVKAQFAVPLISDIHIPQQVTAAAEVVDILQLPAFLSRQTDLVTALAQSQRAINIKKAQFLAPDDMSQILAKCEHNGNHRLMLCERGSCFGYHNLVVDMLGFGVMKQFGYPLIFDVTHALQLPGGLGNAADGRRASCIPLARSGVAQKIAGLFVETHPDPVQARCDGPSALPLAQLETLLSQVQALDQLVKSATFATPNTE